MQAGPASQTRSGTGGLGRLHPDPPAVLPRPQAWGDVAVNVTQRVWAPLRPPVLESQVKSGRLPCRQAPLGTPTHKVSSREWTPRVGEKRGPRPPSFHICSEPRDRLRPALPLRNQPWRRLGAGSESSHKHPGRGASGAPPAMGCVRGGGPGWGLCRLPGAPGRRLGSPMTRPHFMSSQEEVPGGPAHGLMPHDRPSRLQETFLAQRS